jgi:tetratricopeptide (TPR) repeat protein
MEGTVVLTCHHVVAAVERSDLRVRLPTLDGTLGEPVEVDYDEGHSRPDLDTAVLRVPEDAAPLASAIPLLYKLGANTYDGSLNATVLTRLNPDNFDAIVRPSTLIDVHADPGADWPETPERYRVHAFRLSQATYSRPGFSGGVVLCEGGVLGLAHFGRRENEYSAREDYLVPLSTWADGWPALGDLIEPLVDEKLRDAATVKRSVDLSIGLGADVLVPDYRPELYLEREVDRLANRALDERGGVVVVGRPLSGKSRLASELLRRNPRTLVVVPKPNNTAPPGNFEVSGFSGEEAIILFDDLHRTAKISQTAAWRRTLEEATGRLCKVICTSRDGEDWREVETEQGRLLEALGKEEAIVFTSKVGDLNRQWGEDLSGDQGWDLANEIGMDAAEFGRRFDGTPGSLLLDLDDMRRRYEALRDENRNGISMGRLLDALKLLYRVGVPAMSDAMLRSVVEQVRGSGPLDEETWDTLHRRTGEEGFIALEEGTKTISSYAPYLEQCVLYEPSAKDLERFSTLMEEGGDVVILFFLVAYQGSILRDYERALSLVERAIELDPGFAPSWYNKSFVLNSLGRNDQALEAIERAIYLNPEYHSSYYSKGWALTDLGKYEEALDCFREAIDR